MRASTKGDVMWFMPKKKRPFAYSTKATSDLIVALAETHDTIQQIYDAINFDYAAKGILQEYIGKGYGQVVAKTWFKY